APARHDEHAESLGVGRPRVDGRLDPGGGGGFARLLARGGCRGRGGGGGRLLVPFAVLLARLHALLVADRDLGEPQLPADVEQHDDARRDEQFAEHPDDRQTAPGSRAPSFGSAQRTPTRPLRGGGRRGIGAGAHAPDSRLGARPRRVAPSVQAMILRMARSKTRTKPAASEPTKSEDAPNPVWFKPVMFGFMLIGLAWIIVYYVSQNS